MPMKNSKLLSIRFTPEARQEVTDEAGKRGMSDSGVMKAAFAEFIKEPVIPPNGTQQAIEAITLASEPLLVNTEKGFTLGVEAACEAVAKSTRLSIKMATGRTLGEDIAAQIRLNLLG